MAYSFRFHLVGLLVGAITSICSLQSRAWGDPLELTLQTQVETRTDSGRYHTLQQSAAWAPAETALIVCDMWDLHHCLNAVRRVNQIAPRLESVLQEARQRGVTIIHAPSSCMETYAKHPARQRASDTPAASRLPHDIQSWCSVIPVEERAVYPLDQSDGGEDDDPSEHAQWKMQLAAQGRDPAAPWKAQTSLLTIDPNRDYISDQGDEIWNILQARSLRNVILTGVHLNMCVSGRPFGLRQLTRNGKNVALMRDLTDTMYNPLRWPYVSHFTGTDLMVSHVERYLCPTITSDQFLGGQPLRFQRDQRPHLVVVMAEDEYHTQETLPPFAAQQLGHDFRVSYLYASEQQAHHIPGLAVMDDADVLLVSVRRYPLPAKELAYFRRHVAQGKPVIGIRTASHAFSLRNQKLAAGLASWPEFNAQVFGGNYQNHYANDLQSTVQLAPSENAHPIIQGITFPWTQGGSLYQVSPLAAGTTVLLQGHLTDGPEATSASEPVAWTYLRSDGGRSFYTSLGHVDDFANPEFVRFLANGIRWASGLPNDQPLSDHATNEQVIHGQARTLPVPSDKSTLPATDYSQPGMLGTKFGSNATAITTPADPLFVPRVFTRPGAFTSGIEGPACDSQGNVFAVNFGEQGTIGRVTPAGKGERWITLPTGSVGNGIRFAANGKFYVADYPQHNVLQVDPTSRQVTILAHHEQMHQPNDLAIGPTGVLYASDPNWSAGTGQLWRIEPDGTVQRLATALGTTNGIEVSPDGRTLYVNESTQRNLWAFTLTADHQLANKRLVHQFPDFGMDGMRCDVDGNLYITRHGKGTVVKMSPTGKILQEIDVLGAHPSNLCFGGPDGCTVYVTEVDFARIVQFRVDRPGLAWQRWQQQ